jgi:hypothetical protein
MQNIKHNWTNGDINYPHPHQKHAALFVIASVYRLRINITIQIITCTLTHTGITKH